MFFSLWKRTLRVGAKSLWMHRLRSFLTTLGIIFGVASVIAMLAIGEGASRQAQEEIARLGSCNIILETVKPPEETSATSASSSPRLREYGLTYGDAERIRLTLPHAEVTVPVRLIDQEVRYRSRRAAIKVIGTIPGYTDISPVRVNEGRFLTSTDLEYQSGVCVLDEKVAREIFLSDDPLGQDVKIRGDYYRVVGIAAVVAIAPASAAGMPGETKTDAPQSAGVIGNVYIPLSTIKARFGEIIVEGGAGSGPRLEKVQLQQITVRVASPDQVLVTRDILESLLANSPFHKKKDFKVTVPLELLRQAAATKRIFSIVLGSIAAISLLVGGIGIMNIMLASVSERTREIGIRRALGATRRNIIVQFLTETVLLTLIGGILGIAVGAAIPYFVTRFANMPTLITGVSLFLAFGISAAVGVTFGLYPAYRAANMDPIESLRHE